MKLAATAPWAVVLAAFASVTGCGGPESLETGPVEASVAPIRLVDVSANTGITWVHDAGRSEQRRLPETMAGGVAVFDADGDGLADLAFTSLGDLEGRGGGVSLWRNLGGLRFAEVTGAIESDLHAMGLAVADVDGDGSLDLLVTGVGGDELWLGGPGGVFRRAGPELFEPPPPGFSASAAFLEPGVLEPGDKNGLALLITRYVEWQLETDQPCVLEQQRVYCTPELYPAVASRFLVDQGEGLRDRTRGSGFEAVPGKALGVVVLDANGDGRLDLAVAHDTVPNQLFVAGAGGFAEDALAAGFALGASGVARGGMGIAAGDLDGGGEEDLVVGNFSREAAGIFRAAADGTFQDVAAEVGIGLATHLPLAFGVLVVDLDLDGALDIVVANGHIEPAISELSGGVESWPQRLQVFHNRGDGTFEAVGAIAGAWVGRGLAVGDLDGDGDLDLVLAQNGGPPVVLRNDSPTGSSLRVVLEGPQHNRAGLGTALTLELSDGRRLERRLEPAGSYLSASEPVVTFGLGESRPRRLVVEWIDGSRRVLEDLDGAEAKGRLVVAYPR